MTTLIVGGGWSGLAAAVRLLEKGESIHLVESAKQLGGRARNVDWNAQTIDNGQHLLIGAYQRTLKLLQDLGADESRLFQRLPLNITIHHPHFGDLKLADTLHLPWPLSLAIKTWQLNGFAVFVQISRLIFNARSQKKSDDISVQAWLKQQKQSSRLVEQLWEPLCLATLNTPISEASANLFAHVLLETFRQRDYADFLIPQVPLGDTLPAYAERYIQQQGGQISLQTRIKSLVILNNKVTAALTDNGQTIEADNIIIATGPHTSQQLLGKYWGAKDASSHPIVTVYLQCASDIHLRSPMLGLSGTTSQWIFDRGDGLLAVVISGPGSHLKLTNEQLIEHVVNELLDANIVQPSEFIRGYVIREKRATFRSTVGVCSDRPTTCSPVDGLYLAGDIINNLYPATLEGAVINGEKAAELIMKINTVS
ncbi:oxidoreductase [Methylophaga thalassica]|uniref:Oxidoreductase n=1 Tax=Methylophaga thalassica TaxID=40223 RepID=A0ABQ5TYT4_9GAMM|nr:hydroxysqualene dehydroxylase HpnE [Methylophaga thalassica]GLQ00916.1 oxidoreductase [Methylophaga thalassica]